MRPRADRKGLRQSLDDRNGVGWIRPDVGVGGPEEGVRGVLFAEVTHGLVKGARGLFRFGGAVGAQRGVDAVDHVRCG